MAGLPPGDPQLVSMIVSHLKTQGLFDQFRRECLADVDTKPAYLNLKQRVDNFVSNHLSNHTWSPHLNKNQLRNNIRQLVLQSGMLEQGVDRIVAQVVDPKINHIFRPQVERVVREFLSPGSCSEEPPAPLFSTESKPDSSITEQASSSAPTTTAESDAMSILDTINSLNQKANVRTSSEKVSDEPMELEESEQDMGIVEEGVCQLEEAEEAKMTSELDVLEVKTEDTPELREVVVKEEFVGEVKIEEEGSGDHEQKIDEKEKTTGKTLGKSSEEKQDDDQLKSPSQATQKAKERMKEEYSLEDSDLEGLSDITVSSVHTSDLSSFEGQSDEEQLLSDSSEEGELPPDDERTEKKRDTGEEDKECKPRRKAYVHKPFLYSRYYSDSDDEITVEERRRSAAKDKEERLLKRQQNRERMEEKRKQKAAQAEEQSYKKQKSRDPTGLEGPRAKEARKERKVLEKKMALNRRRKLDSRKEGDVSSKKKGDVGGEGPRKVELKSTTSKTPQLKLIRNLSESAPSEERHRRTSGSVSEDSSETKKMCDKGLTHSFILDLEQGSQEALKQRSGKFDRLSRKELHIKERKEKERSLSDERAKLKQKQEKKPEHQADDTPQKEGMKSPSDEKGEKKPKIKSEKKLTANTREGKLSLSEGIADEGPKEVKKVKTTSTEAAKAEKDKTREKDKCKEKLKGEKTSAKSDFKLLQRPESVGSSEDRSDMDPGSDSSKKKHSKEVLKRSKSHSEDKQGERTKSKTDTKDTDKEKAKVDQDSQKLTKSNFETEKDPKRVKPTEKGATLEKAKSKSKEETKSLSDKKVQGSEVRSVAGASTSKPEVTKEKKKERNAKEQRKVSEEPSHEKSEVKSGKKKLEKDKIPEKNSESPEEKKEPTEEKLERSDKSSKSSVSSLSLETEEVPKKQALLQDASADSDPVTTTVTTSFSDDTCDALSDITPEPLDGDTDSQLCEVPAQADALLTLMDVCTAAGARLAPECFREDVSSERALEDADMKMKEAALTLLSMDPDSTVASSFIIHNMADDPGENEAAPQPMQSPPAVEEEQHLPVDMATAAETEVTTIEAPAPPQHTAELVEETPNTAGGADNSEREVDTSKVEISETLAPQEPQDSLEEDEPKKAEILPEAQLKDEPSPTAADKEAPDAAVFEPEKLKGTTEENTGCVACSITDIDSERSIVFSKDEQMEPDVSDTKTSPKQTEDMAEENLDTTDNSEAESKKVEDEHVPAMSEPHSIETNVPDKNEETSEAEPDMQSVVEPIESISSADSQGDENASELPEQEERTEGRGRRKRKLSSQKSAVVKEFTGDEKDEKGNNEEPSAEETEQTPVVEDKTACRGQSSRTTDETGKDRPETLDEPSSHSGSCSGAAAKEDIADNQNTDENKQGSSSGEPAENEEQTNEESATKESDERGSQISLPTPVQEDTEAAGSSESENTADTPQPTVKKRSSEEMEESVEETPADKKVKEADSQEEHSEQPPQKDNCGLSSRSPSDEQEDVKEETTIENKLDDTEEEQQHEDQEVIPKRVVRRGRPPKAAAAAATDDSDKKDKKLEKKESEQNDDKEEDDGEEEKETTTRATTRLASRLEAERNKPSKPSTRASRQSGKDETAAGTRGTRGPAAAAKGGRKREASPPAVRTRGGQKSEEPPSKRAKR